MNEIGALMMEIFSHHEAHEGHEVSEICSFTSFVSFVVKSSGGINRGRCIYFSFTC